MDNVPKETPVVSVMTHKPLETVVKVRDEKRRSSTPASHSKEKTDWRRGTQILKGIRQ